VATDLLYDAVRWATLEPLRLSRAARAVPPRRVLVLAVVRESGPTLIDAAAAELRRSRHDVTLVRGPVGTRGKFENLNALLAGQDLPAFDWLLVLDDDVALPHGFLDGFVFLCERFELDLAQPAHRARSHAAWAVTRRHPFTAVRESRFVEIGPAVAFAPRTFDVILPFPPLRYGWGLDNHWAAVAAERSWRLGIVDATAIGHGIRRIATGYGRGDAEAEAAAFLAERPYVPRWEVLQTVAEHRRW
jgi:hypothetical protein